jgi:branched-subunit amino acid transport protein
MSLVLVIFLSRYFLQGVLKEKAHPFSFIFMKTRLNSQRFLQFHPTVILVAYVNSCFIINAKKNFKNNHQNQRHLSESVMQWLVCLV